MLRRGQAYCTGTPADGSRAAQDLGDKVDAGMNAALWPCGSRSFQFREGETLGNGAVAPSSIAGETEGPAVGTAGRRVGEVLSAGSTRAVVKTERVTVGAMLTLEVFKTERVTDEAVTTLRALRAGGPPEVKFRRLSSH